MKKKTELWGKMLPPYLLLFCGLSPAALAGSNGGDCFEAKARLGNGTAWSRSCGEPPVIQPGFAGS